MSNVDAGAQNILGNWEQLVEQSQLMVMMIDSSPTPATFAESVTPEFVSVYSDFCSTQRNMAETLSKRRQFDNAFSAQLAEIEKQAKGANKGLSLEAHLLNPMQRITKYPQLLER